MDEKEEVDSGAGGCKISCLPPELLAVIFILARAEPKEHPASFSKIPLEILVSHVSSHWRAVSLATLALWNQVHIRTPRSICRYTRSRASRYLERSGSQCPLDIYVNISNWERGNARNRERPYFIRSFADYIITHLPQTRSLFFECFHESTLLWTLSRLRNVSAPNLRRLEVKFNLHTLPRGPREIEFSILKLGSPQLAFVKNMGNCMPVFASLHRLTSLHLHKDYFDIPLTYPILVDVMKAPDCLLYLSIGGKFNMETWPLQAAAPDFQLHHLKALQINYPEKMVGHLLLYLSAPNLESLWLVGAFKDFSIFCNSSGYPRFPRLRYLTLQGSYLPSIMPISSAFPSITHLNLHLYDTPILETVLSGQWSSLHTLVFTWDESWKQMGDIITSFLQRRISDGRPIDNFLVTRNVLNVLERKAWTGIPVETKVRLVSAGNYLEPWWNQEDRI